MYIYDGRVQVLNSGHRDLVNELRSNEYQKAKGFYVAPAGIAWNRSDDESIVLGAFHGSKLISTMRIEIIEDPKLLEKKLECPWNFPAELRFPIMLLSKASTDSAYRNDGLNAMLRKYAFEMAKEWQIPFILGTFIAGSPRVNSMKEMGYEFFTNKIGWNQTNYKSYNEVLVALLDVERKIDQALAVVEGLAGESKKNFNWVGAKPRFKIVENVS